MLLPWGIPPHVLIVGHLLRAGEALFKKGDAAAATSMVREAMQQPKEPTQYVFGGGSGLPTVSSGVISAHEGQGILLIDSFMFNGDIAAEVRLNATAHFFDLIIVVEAWEPLAPSSPKKLWLYSETQYWRAVFARFGSKVRVAVVSRT